MTARTPKAAQPSAAPWRPALPRTLTRWRVAADWRWALAETTLLMLAAIGLSAWLRPQDPLWTGASFPWLWLVAAVLALRYGSVQAVWAMGLALAAWLLLDMWRAPLGEFPRASFLGGLVLALIAGEFSDVWNLRLLQAQNVNVYLQERLNALTQSHYLLAASHDRLEQELLARPFSLRETLYALRQRIALQPRADGPLVAADWLLTLLAQACRLEAAAIVPVRDGRTLAQPVAVFGPFGAEGPVAADDPMLREALARGELMHVQSEPMIDPDRTSRYVVCAPIVCADGRILAVLLVERMAFTALTLETLQFMTVLAAYYADSVDAAPAVAAVQARFPDCPAEFAAELGRVQRLLRTTFVQSSLVAFALPPEAAAAAEWSQRLQQVRRGLDMTWLAVRDGRRTLVVLLPLTAGDGVGGFLERAAATLRARHGADWTAAGITARSAAVGDAPLADQLAALLGADDA
ncbi:MAG: GAF domain-containing protein [Burkholderiaceae bacterium]|nr:GAF domain-containing protein [Burkholderiaceae bacterium]